MSQVRITIGGKGYTIACAPGQEGHISHLARIVEEKYSQLGSGKAPLEAQNLVFASLFMADELNEFRKSAGSGDSENLLTDPVQDDAARLRSEAETLQNQNKLLSQRIKLLESALKEARANQTAQPDMFGDDLGAEELEALADKIESFADLLEANGS